MDNILRYLRIFVFSFLVIPAPGKVTLTSMVFFLLCEELCPVHLEKTVIRKKDT